MFFFYSSDYIKFLNDPDCNRMNYDQWKDKKMRQGLKKSKKNGGKINPFNSKYNY